MLEWYVFTEGFNSREIEKHNVFNHYRFLNDLKKLARKFRDREREQFEEAMRKDLMYYYWSKCEWEVVIGGFIGKADKSLKVDVYEQVMLNWKPFCDYVWEHRVELRKVVKEDSKDD